MIRQTTQWSEREMLDHDELKRDTNYYDRKVVVSQVPPHGEITLFAVVSSRGQLRTIEAPIVPMSIADTVELIQSLQAALARRVGHLERNPA